ncbi:diguanylate cyclase domain-containing protein [Porticoccus sp.]
MKATEPVCLADVIELMLDAVCVVDRRGHFVFVNGAFERIFGYQADEVIGHPMLDLVFHDDRENTLQAVATLLAGEPQPCFENRWIRRDGQVVHVLWSARWSEEHQVRIAVAHDITERKRMEERLQHMAGHDPLTGLPNRALLLDRIQTALTQARRDQTHLSLLFIDIDNFKHINDSYGHFVGDALLEHIARRLKNCVRESDTVGRLGGDEFLILLNRTSTLDDAVVIAEKIRAELEQPFALGGRQLHIAPSIGIAHNPDSGEDYQQLIQCADQAMYRAKKAGGNRIAVF